MAKKIAGVVIFAAILLGTYELYEHHLSTGVKVALSASLSADSQSESTNYLHDAMAQVRTKKDGDVVAQVIKMQALTEQHGQLEYRIGWDSEEAKDTGNNEKVIVDQQELSKNAVEIKSLSSQIAAELRD